MNQLFKSITTLFTDEEVLYLVNKAKRRQQIANYTHFVKQVVSQMLPLDRELFEEDYCMNYLERYAERLNILKPCDNPLPNVCSCCRDD